MATMCGQNDQSGENNALSEILNLFGKQFDFIDSNTNWLTGDNKRIEDERSAIQWLQDPLNVKDYVSRRSRLIDELESIKHSQRSIDTRTFSRNKHSYEYKNGYSPNFHVNNSFSKLRNEEIVEENGIEDETFIVEAEECNDHLNGANLDSTFVAKSKETLNSTFTMKETIEEPKTKQPLINVYNELQEMARKQEETLCSGLPTNVSPNRTYSRSSAMRFDNRANNETVTKRIALNHVEFGSPIHYESEPKYMSTPLHSDLSNETRYYSNNSNGHLNITKEVFQESTFIKPHVQPVIARPVEPRRYSPPKIMPMITNLKQSDKHAAGRSLPNLSRKLNLTTTKYSQQPQQQHFTSKLGSQKPVINATQMNGSQRPRAMQAAALPVPSMKTQQQIHPPLTDSRFGAALNLKRTATFKVRGLQECNSDENIRIYNNETNINDGYVDECVENKTLSKCGPLQSVTNIRAMNGFTNGVESKISRIPGPKSARSGIPVPGVRNSFLPQRVSKLPEFTNGHQDERMLRDMGDNIY